MGYKRVGRRARLPAQIRLPEQPTELAYLAGIVDGEGSIVRRTYSPGNWRVVVTNTSDDLITWLHAMSGARTYRRQRSERHRPVSDWTLSRSEDVLLLLEAIAPYMKIKRLRAELAIAELRRHGQQMKLEVV